MAQKEVTYQSSSYLSCANCLPANVIICLPSSLINPVVCPDGITDEPYEYRQIEARITAVCKSTSCGSSALYTYTIDYNEDLVNTDLLARNIQGVFCKGCLTDWVEDLVGDEIQIDVGDYEVTITSQHGCETTFALNDVNELLPIQDCTFDIGSPEFRYKDLYLCGDMTIDGEIIMTASLIRTNTSDGADDHSITITGAGAASTTRGARIVLYGNEGAGPGRIDLVAGNVTGGTINFNTGALVRWQVNESGQIIQDATNGSDIVFNTTLGIIRQGTSDAADTKHIVIAGGGTGDSSRGGYIQLSGNESSSPGRIVLEAGNATGGNILIKTRGAAEGIEFYTVNALRWSINSSGQIVQNATNGSDVVFNLAAGVIRQGTSGGADTSSISLAGGGTASYLRGSSVIVHGINHATYPGGLRLQGGDNASGHVDSVLGNGSALFRWISAGGTTRWTMDSGGTILPGANLAYDIGSVSVAARVIYTGTVQGNTSNNLQVQARAGSVYFATVSTDSAPLNRFRVSSTGNFEQDITNGGDVILNSLTNSIIRLGTDGSAVSNSLKLIGGNAASAAQGAYIQLNTTFASGDLDFYAGSAGEINFYPSGDTNRKLQLLSSSDTSFQIVFGDGSTATQGLTLRAATSDGADDSSITIAAGGGTGITRGASLVLYGNENGSGSGGVQIFAGDVAGNAITLLIENATSSVRIRDNTSGNRWTFNNDGTFNQDATNGSDIVLNNSTGVIRQGTSDGADNKIITINGGGASANEDRGGFISVRGNEASVGGSIILYAGNISGSVIQANLLHSGSRYVIQDNNGGNELLSLTRAGKVIFYNTVTAGGTTGNQSINKPSGTVNFAAGASTLTVTNSLCTTSSIILAMARTNDTTAQVKNVVPGSGSFVINLAAAATAETSVGFLIIN